MSHCRVLTTCRKPKYSSSASACPAIAITHAAIGGIGWDLMNDNPARQSLKGKFLGES